MSGRKFPSMHLIYYGHGILDLHGFSTPLSAVILVGAGYGFTSLLRDLVKAMMSVPKKPI